MASETLKTNEADPKLFRWVAKHAGALVMSRFGLARSLVGRTAESVRQGFASYFGAMVDAAGGVVDATANGVVPSRVKMAMTSNQQGIARAERERVLHPALHELDVANHNLGVVGQTRARIWNVLATLQQQNPSDDAEAILAKWLRQNPRLYGLQLAVDGGDASIHNPHTAARNLLNATPIPTPGITTSRGSARRMRELYSSPAAQAAHALTPSFQAARALTAGESNGEPFTDEDLYARFVDVVHRDAQTPPTQNV